MFRVVFRTPSARHSCVCNALFGRRSDRLSSRAPYLLSWGSSFRRAGVRACVGSTAGLAILTLAAPSMAAGVGLDVGSISELDLEAVRRIIDQSDDFGMPAAAESRALSLEASVKTALENNLQLQISELGVEAGAQEIDASRAKFHPTLGASGSADGNKRANSDTPDERRNSEEILAFVEQQVPTGGNVRVGAGYGRDFTDENAESGSGNFERTSEIAGLSIEVRQPLLRGGRTYVARREIINSEYDDEINRAELRAQILQVTATTKAAYYKVVQTLRQIEVIEGGLDRDRELLKASTALFEAGRVSKVDVLSAEIRLSNDRARLATAKANYEVAQNELRKVLGLPIEIQIEATDTTIPFRPVEITLDRWIKRAIADRPELVKLRTQLKQAELAIKLRKNSALPSLDVTGTYQPGFDWESYNWGAGVGFSYALGNVAAKSKLKQAEIERHQVQREYTRKKRDIDLEVREVEIRLRESLERLRNLTGQVESARSKGEIARGRFEMGMANNLDITNADEELIRSESMLLEALVDYATNIAVLEARIAGPI